MAPPRLTSEARTELILSKAVRFFASRGFEGTTRDLARYTGVSLALLFKYFGSKAKLIERIYDRLYSERWNGEWEQKLADRSVPLRTRLSEFYNWFLEITDTYDVVRCGLYSGLAGTDLAKRHFERHVIRILEVMAIELRALQEPSDSGERRPTQLELETAWHLHSTFVYYSIRKQVYARPRFQNKAEFIEHVLGLFFDGIQAGPVARSSRRPRTSKLPVRVGPEC